MNAYKNFAYVYDMFMQDIDYDGWVEYLKRIWESQNFKPKLIADLGCGTGNITLRLANMGYDMIGVDISQDMLSVAKSKSNEILYLMQDMCEFELYGTADCIISLCDSLNYITDKNELLKVFKLVNNYLEPNGLFIFDINTEYKFKKILAENTFAETKEDAAYIWENYFDEDSGINEFYMNFFIKQNKENTYSRFEECHYEKAYTIDEIKEFIEKSGMKLIDYYEAYTFNKPHDKSERIFFVAQEILKRRA